MGAAHHLYADVPDLIGEFAEGRNSARDEILQNAIAELRLARED